MFSFRKLAACLLPGALLLLPSVTPAAPTPAAQSVAINTLLKFDDKTERQREAYRQAVTFYKSGNFAQAEQLRSSLLKDYPLNVWLDYYALAAQPNAGLLPKVKSFVSSGRHRELGELLTQKYVEFLAGRGNFKAVAELLPKLPYPEADQYKITQRGMNCRFHEARWQTGRAGMEAVAHAAQVYASLGKTPQSCYGLLGLWAAKGYQSGKVVLSKFERVYITRRHEGTTRTLAVELQRSDYGPLVQQAMRLYGDPEQVLALTPDGTDIQRRAAVLAFRRYANLNAHNAQLALTSFEQRFKPTRSEQLDIRRTLSDGLMAHGCSRQDLQWVDSHLPAVGWTDALREKRLRRAIWFAQWQMVYDLTRHLSAAQRQEINWRYWQAHSAVKLGLKKGREMLTAVAADRSFFGFLAAQQLGLKGRFNHQALRQGVSLKELVGHEAVRRFLELYAMDDKDAMIEWREVSKHTSEDVALQMADWALASGNVNYAIQGVIAGRRWDALDYRFPAPYRELYQKFSSSTKVSLSFLYGISRQESMMNPVIRSPAGAVGLMQLMPETARVVSRMNKWDYRGVSDLVIPEKNIRLGSMYLRNMLDKFDGNRVLAAAAYNAGPQRVYRWASKDGLKRDTAMYVENIPFDETRKYVQNVLLYDAIYNKLLNGRDADLLSGKEMSYLY